MEKRKKGHLDGSLTDSLTGIVKTPENIQIDAGGHIMRDINRIDPIMEELAKAWKQPGWNDMRFGQFMSNILGDIAQNNGIGDIWFPEDDKWLEWLRNFNKTFENEGKSE